MAPEKISMLQGQALYQDSVTEWIEQVRDGDEIAAQQLWERYVDRLIRLARNKLRYDSRRVVDEEDVVVCAFDGFFRGVQQGKFPKLNDRDDAWQLLVVLTERKAIDLRRRTTAAKRGGGEVRGESVLGSRALSEFAVDQPSVEFATLVADELRTILEKLGDDMLRRVMVEHMAGYTNPEIAEMLRISLRSVERKLRIIRDVISRSS